MDVFHMNMNMNWVPEDLETHRALDLVWLIPVSPSQGNVTGQKQEQATGNCRGRVSLLTMQRNNVNYYLFLFECCCFWRRRRGTATKQLALTMELWSCLPRCCLMD